MVEARVSIPEKLILHTFDLNVVLGNLLDNAIEAAGRTEEKRLKVMIKLEKGVLFINIRNSCQGIADGKPQRLETTKEDASIMVSVWAMCGGLLRNIRERWSCSVKTEAWTRTLSCI